MKQILLSAGIALCMSSIALAQGMSGPPAPQDPLCVQASESSFYNARPIGRHDVFIQNSLGKDRRGLRLTTTCIDLDPIATTGIAVHSFSRCVSMGDRVSAVTIDGHIENCRVSRVAPFVEGSEEKGYK